MADAQACWDKSYSLLSDDSDSTWAISVYGSFFPFTALSCHRSLSTACCVFPCLASPKFRYSTAYGTICMFYRYKIYYQATVWNAHICLAAGGIALPFKPLRLPFSSHQKLWHLCWLTTVNIDGDTIHSGMSIYSERGSYRTGLFNFADDKMEALKRISVLIIDEVSMVDGRLLDYISSVFARLKGNNQPFGNMHVVVFGDLLQLPPVDGIKVFKANVWRLFHPLFLEQPRRQSDEAFFRVLNKIRFGGRRWGSQGTPHRALAAVRSSTVRLGHHVPLLTPQRVRRHEPHCAFGNAPGQGCYIQRRRLWEWRKARGDRKL